ncbi:hypothetical protein DY000_02010960 [Brassica cretica]|uniref:Uncharacterized protein n=1 Tax=Brassica cretica TaxID=69181 RepID=A0ABQ7D090_BRACR|nr:hypothetical protein DY000_02010960 [Brassica cretica]
MTLSLEDHREGRCLLRGMRSGETKHGYVALTASRGGDGQVEAVCDACRSDGADASTCSAASLLDAFDPADVGWACMVWAAGRL